MSLGPSLPISLSFAWSHFLFTQGQNSPCSLEPAVVLTRFLSRKWESVFPDNTKKSYGKVSGKRMSVIWATLLSLNNSCGQVDKVLRPGPGQKLIMEEQDLPYWTIYNGGRWGSSKEMLLSKKQNVPYRAAKIQCRLGFYSLPLCGFLSQDGCISSCLHKILGIDVLFLVVVVGW